MAAIEAELRAEELRLRQAGAREERQQLEGRASIDERGRPGPAA